MRITVLGTGTSTGVPVPCCSCPVCRSTDKRNRRLRTSLHVEIQAQDLAAGAQPPGTPEHEVCAAIQIDTGPDFRFQALRAGLRRIDAVLYTHTHADHIAGIDDLRGFNFIRNEPIPVYAGAESAAELRQRFGYCFTTSPDYEGGSPPDLTLQLIEPFRPLLFAGFEVLPLPVMHGSAQVLAFRFGPFAYATDCSAIPEQTMAALSGGFHLADPARFLDPATQLLSGTFLFAAFFIVTDYVTAPATGTGKLIFGAGVAFLTFVIRTFAAYPEGIGFAVLLMNATVPLIDHVVRPRIYGRTRSGEPIRYEER